MDSITFTIATPLVDTYLKLTEGLIRGFGASDEFDYDEFNDAQGDTTEHSHKEEDFMVTHNSCQVLYMETFQVRQKSTYTPLVEFMFHKEEREDEWELHVTFYPALITAAGMTLTEEDWENFSKEPLPVYAMVSDFYEEGIHHAAAMGS